MNSFKIELLNRDNYDTWCLQAEAVLEKDDVWEYACGMRQRPVVITGDTESQVQHDIWTKHDRKARSNLILMLSPLELKHVKNCQTSNEIWEKLKSIYQSHGPAKKASLIKTLILTKLREGEDIRDHITKFLDTADKLADLEIKINEELLSVLLLYSLPDSYNTFRTAIETRDNLPKLEILKVKILEEFDGQSSREQQNSDALIARQRDENRLKSTKFNNAEYKNQQSKPQCTFCKKFGHLAKVCRKKKKQDSQQKCTKSEACTLLTQESVLHCKTSNDFWCLDSGATSHMCRDKTKFINWCPITNTTLDLADNNTTTIEAIGTARIHVDDRKQKRIFNLPNTLYVPSLRTNLLSISKITEKGYKVQFDQFNAKIISKNGVTVIIANRIGNLYYIRCQKELANISVEESQINQLEDWHAKFGHLHVTALKKLLDRGGVKGLKFNKEDSLDACKTCIMGKMSRLPFPHSLVKRTSQPLEIIHTDLCGPMRTKSLGGSIYFATFIDDYTRWTEVRFIKSKNELFNTLKNIKIYLENQTGLKIKAIQSDNGGEYCSKEMNIFLEQNGIVHRTSTARTPQQNGVAERKNRTLVEMARCMMIHANAPASYWAEATYTANHIRNRCPSRSINNKTPYELWKKRIPDVSYFRTFGSRAFVLNKNPNKYKYDPRSQPCTFVGYSETSKAYRVIIDGQRNVTTSREIKFINEMSNVNLFEDFIDDKVLQKVSSTIVNQPKSTEVTVQPTIISTQERNESQNKRGPGRPRKIKTGNRGRPLKQYNMVPVNPSTKCDEKIDEQTEITNLINQFAGITEVPFHQAMQSPEVNEWKTAIKKEISSLLENNTWDLVDKPSNRKPIASRIILCNKSNSDGTLERRKARLVAKGYTQEKGIDYEEIFAPVARLNSIRTIMALAAESDLEVHQLDVTTAFLNGEIKENIIMEVPIQLAEILQNIIDDKSELKDVRRRANEWLKCLKDNKPKVCKLNKAIYGLKQAGRQWYKKLDTQLRQIGLKPLTADPCIYIKQEDGFTLIIAIYVDDIIIACNDKQKLTATKTKLGTMFKLRDIGPIHWALGIEFSQTEKEGERIITMSQKQYSLEIIRRFGMENCKPIATPLDGNSKLIKPSEQEILSEEEQKQIPYQNLIGTLMYLSVGTRPDIAHSVSLLSQFNTCYNYSHWNAAKRVLRYIKGTLNYGITFRKTGKPLEGYVDADWGANPNDRHSYTGFIFKLGGAAISWESRKQRTIALSSTEAEYIGLTEAAKEAIYLKRFLYNVQPKSDNPITIYNDNQSAQKLSRNPVFHSRTKHIDIRHHFIREAVEQGDIDVKYLPTNEMPADALTKPLFSGKHKWCVADMGIGPIETLLIPN